ncbi:MAG TPA: alpha/beta hydrolase [Cyclobacteriaceae bacterium]|jgi:pimeloyl-ACP methyl ester carboxylesterase|nr:lipolytic protein [uncultured bacterium]
MKIASTALALLFSSGLLFAQQKPTTYVIVHGAWGGGWAFKEVDSMMTAAGHVVYRPSLTGQGERAHLASPEISLSTHINDVVNQILFERLTDVVLVGHSYGGMVITGVADRIPERIRKLVYLDAILPNDGESVMTAMAGGSEWIKSMERDGMIVPAWVQPEQPYPKDVPQSLKTFTEPVSRKNPAAKSLPTVYILTIDPGKTAEEDGFAAFAKRAQERGYKYIEMIADHNPQWSKPRELADVLLEAGK